MLASLAIATEPITLPLPKATRSRRRRAPEGGADTRRIPQAGQGDRHNAEVLRESRTLSPQRVIAWHPVKVVVLDHLKQEKTEVPAMEKKPEALAKIDELAITPLSDEELDSVAGGYTDSTTAASCICCVAGASVIKKEPVVEV